MPDDTPKMPAPGECKTCMREMRLVAALAPALGDRGHYVYSCDTCGGVEWVAEMLGRRT